MSERCNKYWSGWALGLAIIAGPSLAQDALSVCFVADDLPRSEQKTQTGLDVDLMRAVAERMNVALQPVWIATEQGMVEVEESDLPLSPLAGGQCDALASVGGELVFGDDAEQFQLTQAYVGAAFELVGQPGTPSSMDRLNGKPVAVQAVSLAHLVMQKQGIPWQSYETPVSQLHALDSGEVDAALIWGANLAGSQWQPVEQYVPPVLLRWNHHIAVRQQDDELFARLTTALEAMLSDGTVRNIYARWGVPYRAPFDSVFNYTALDEL